MAARPTYLQLPPEMGALRFGPFPGTVTFGSDAPRCQIVLDPSHGVFPVHAALTPLGNQKFSVQPSTREGKVFLIPYGQAHVWPVNGPVEAKVGDFVVIGTPHGPRFQIQDAAPIGAAPTAGSIVAGARQTGGEAGFVGGMNTFLNDVVQPGAGGIGSEVARRAGSAALATKGPLREVYNLYHRISTGVFNNPYWIVGLLFAILGLIGTGSVSCTGISLVVADLLGMAR